MVFGGREGDLGRLTTLEGNCWCVITITIIFYRNTVIVFHVFVKFCSYLRLCRWVGVICNVIVPDEICNFTRNARIQQRQATAAPVEDKTERVTNLQKALAVIEDCDLPEGKYLELCNLLMDVHRRGVRA